ncbi:hypothetical protein [Staphylococcus pseudoxylosus]|uniref:hypothetical protein n=1 Tax=Staphylococcus pseudoxylosus TaxID=2282419 RepID=UPI00193A778C|nr:hypothetical protein [Staphylococcus pseudoxylosus]MBM2659768.1 hypothetical protein [Staphylococcus pseudoxylosus]
MDNIKVGLIVAPHTAEKLTKQCLELLSNYFKKMFSEVNFEFEIEQNVVIGSAEHVDRCIGYAYKKKQKKEWDYSICITDLPSFSNNKTVLSDINLQKQTAMISLPALGLFRIRHKLRSVIIDIISYIYETSKNRPRKSTFEKFSFPKIRKVTPNNEFLNNERYIYNSTAIGMAKTIFGMTYANEPWKAVISFKKVIALGLATGTYISIFSTPWQLSVEYEWPRFVILMLISFIGMVVWLVYAHNFWEPPSSKSKKKYRYLYNFTTLLTMFCLIFLSYIVLFFLLLTSIVLFVPDNLFESWGYANESYSISNYLRLSWLISSAGLLAGSLGTVMEGESKMKELTYTDRQVIRSKKIQNQVEKEESLENENPKPSSYKE